MNPSKAAVWLACLGLLSACSGDDFEGSTSGGAAGVAGDDGGVGGVSGSGGASGSAGAGGLSGSGGASGSAGQGGSAGAPACKDGSCKDDEYCHSDGSCRTCLDFDEFDFETPEALSTINAAHSLDLRAPRALDEHKSLLFTVSSLNSLSKLHYSTDYTLDGGQAMLAPFDGGDFHERDPMLTYPVESGPLAGMALFFDRTVSDYVLGTRRLWGSIWDPNKKEFLPPTELGPPYNPADAAKSTWSVAVAGQAKRVWFVSNRDGALNPKLYTAPTAPGATAVTVSLITAPYNCPVKAYELSPWVTANGAVLFFQAPETAAGCVEGPKHDLYMIPLAPNGQALGLSAQPLAVNLPSTHDFSPSVSFDACWLYFASDRDLSPRLQLYRARRK
jgi:hypothetical protein